MNKLRTLAIIDYVKQRKYCSSSELAAAFKVSPATIQRDIVEIVRKNILRKVHGGIAAHSPLPEATADSLRFPERIKARQTEKQLIAACAEQHIESDDTLFIDSSTTSLHLARRLQQSNFSNLTIVTNSVFIAQEFHLFPQHYVLICLGGSYNPQLNSFLGRFAIDNMQPMPISKAFLSAVGLSPTGTYTYHESHAEYLRLIIATAHRSYLLLDSSKFGKTALFKVAEPGQIDALITERQPTIELSENFDEVHYPAQDETQTTTQELAEAIF